MPGLSTPSEVWDEKNTNAVKQHLHLNLIILVLLFAIAYGYEPFGSVLKVAYNHEL